MAIDLAPSEWIASWSEDATNVSFPIASVPELTAAEADGTTGDIRKTMFAICERAYQAYLGEASADRPAKMTIARSSSTNDLTGAITRVYQFTFTAEAAVGGIEVSAES